MRLLDLSFWQHTHVVMTVSVTRVNIIEHHRLFFSFFVLNHGPILELQAFIQSPSRNMCSTLRAYCRLPGIPRWTGIYQSICTASASVSEKHCSSCGIYRPGWAQGRRIDLHRCSEPELCFDVRPRSAKSALIYPVWEATEGPRLHLFNVFETF